MFSYLLKRQIIRQQSRSSSKRKKRLYNFSEVKTVTILAEVNQLGDLKPVMRELISDGIRTTLVVLNVQGIEIEEEYPVVSVINIRADDLIFRKLFPGKSIIKRFISLQGPVLCDLTVNIVYPLLFLASLSRASMKLGIKKNGLTSYDLMLQPTQELSSAILAKNLFFYWRSIDIKNNNS
ncbi:DUF6913 domain-containing protein [Coprobacter tertius]|uniref:Uncharacterized protein n=1 Tax=Coprobacter tertius TaxID=2944915 RepID=A0ABT1MHP1_9BACT|nr:hypothetical protein [Coprobacter tertius]MCP9612142.1 hypothetical protein [Coprobacter tertius]